MPEKHPKGRIHKATHTGTISLGEIELPCFVLEDERRVLSTRGVVAAMGLSWSGGGMMARFIAGKRISPYICRELSTGVQSPIRVRSCRGGAEVQGHEATVLIDLCRAVNAARRGGALHPKQANVAKQCDILVDAVAYVGIIALIDEATGYQKQRPDAALQAVLSTILAPYPITWEKRFPDEFFRQLCRLRGVKYNGPGSPMPMFIAGDINNIVYDRIAPGLIAHLKRENPADENGNRPYKHHQLFSEHAGVQVIQNHLATCIALMQISATFESFIDKLDGWRQRYGQTMMMRGVDAEPVRRNEQQFPAVH